MRVFISESLDVDFVTALKSLCAQHAVDVVSLRGKSHPASEDIVLITENDVETKGSTAWVCIVIGDGPPRSVKMFSEKRISPLFFPNSVLVTPTGRALLLGQVERLLTEKWVLRSNLQEIHSRIKELTETLRDQLRVVRILFRNSLRNSFPKHAYVDASYQHTETNEPHIVHYTDFFGDPQSRQLWVFGLRAVSYVQSANMIECLQQLEPNPSQLGHAEFMQRWKQMVLGSADYDDSRMYWIWLCFDFQNAELVAYANHDQKGALWTYGESGVSLLEVLDAKPSTYKITPHDVVFLTLPFMTRPHEKTLKEIEQMYTALEMPSTTALSHLQDQLLQYCNEHGLMKEGGATMLFRLRESTLRMV